MEDASVVKMHSLPVLCHFQCALNGKLHKLSSFFSLLQALQSGMSYDNSTIPCQMANSHAVIVPVWPLDYYYQ